MPYIGNQPFGKTVRTITSETLASVKTLFYPTGGYTVGYVDVYLNGVRLTEDGDFTATDGTLVTLLFNPLIGDTVDIVSYGTVELANAVRRDGDTLVGTLNTRALVPTANITYDIGTSTMRYKDIYLSGNTINLGDLQLTTNGTSFSVSNSTGGVFASALGNTTITGTANVSTGVNVGANVNLSTSQINVGNSTVNAVVTATSIRVGNSSVYSNITSTAVTSNGTLSVTGAATFSNTVAMGTEYLSPQTGMRNRIINGAMVIDQRNAGASVTPASGDYTLDRFQSFSSASSKYSVQRDTTAPSGFINSLKVTSLAATSVAAGDYYMIEHKIEGLNCYDLGWGTASAKTVTLSFQVYSSLTGTFGGAILNQASNRSYPFTYSIASANTWTSVSVTIPGDTSGTWLTTNGVGLYISFSLGMGSTYSGTASAWAGAQYWSATGATSVVGTNVATWFITGVQLEVGSVATPFERRPYGTELALCQRYYQKVLPGGTSTNFASGFASTTTSSRYILHFVTSTRIAPTALETSGTASDYTVNSGAGAPACSSVPAFSQASTVAINFTADVASGLTAGNGAILRLNGATNGYLAWSAEL